MPLTMNYPKEKNKLFSAIPKGEVFFYEDFLYLKLSDIVYTVNEYGTKNTWNAICLKDGDTCYFFDDEVVKEVYVTASVKFI